VHDPAPAIGSLNGDVALSTLEESARRRSVTDQVLLMTQSSPLHSFAGLLASQRFGCVHGKCGAIVVRDGRSNELWVNVLALVVGKRIVVKQKRLMV